MYTPLVIRRREMARQWHLQRLMRAALSLSSSLSVSDLASAVSSDSAGALSGSRVVSKGGLGASVVEVRTNAELSLLLSHLNPRMPTKREYTAPRITQPTSPVLRVFCVRARARLRIYRAKPSVGNGARSGLQHQGRASTLC